MDWYKEKKKEKKWNKKGEGHALGSAADQDAARQQALARMEGGGGAAAPAASRQRSAAEEEAARARLAAIEARSGGGGQAKKRPGSAAVRAPAPAPAPAPVARAPVVRAPDGGGGSTDLPARYIPAGGAGAMGDAQLPVSLSSGVQAPQVGIAPQPSAPPAVSLINISSAGHNHTACWQEGIE